jgi:hypothetical protein
VTPTPLKPIAYCTEAFSSLEAYFAVCFFNFISSLKDSLMK